MGRYCTKCQQAFAEDSLYCPRCAGRPSSVWGRSRLPALQPISDPRIDLGSPVKCALGGDQPPSGASFVSWTVLLQNRKKSLEPEPSRHSLLRAPAVRFGATLLLGFLLGCLLCAALAWTGLVPWTSFGAQPVAPSPAEPPGKSGLSSP
ncbi:hypothetical protein AYO44_02660 [Planctomycetaceae bacterium SCGC AG-212-F19]|nr:hypothetical protein AYO44_02660 [Planctomycetaceae bacterium SCGC AG-212-F19]